MNRSISSQPTLKKALEDQNINKKGRPFARADQLAKNAKSAAMFQNKDKKNLYTAIVFFPSNEKKPHKYRNVTLISFMKYANSMGAYYVNFYRSDKSYSHRSYCEPFIQ